MNRSRRSVLVLPASSRRMAEKATALDAAEVILDLEDAVPNDPAEKERARGQLVETLRELDFGGRTVAVRINGVRGPHALRDVLALVPQVADRIACLVVPKVSSPGEVAFIDHLLSALETAGPGLQPLGLELQIEDPSGLEAVAEIAAASQRTEALIFGPGDFAAAMGMPQLTIGQETVYPGDIWHYALCRIAVAAKAHGLQSIDGPCSDISDFALLERSSQRSAQLGYDGKWAIHPSQLEAVNRAFTPDSEQVRRAEKILAALEGRGGASRLGEEMVDEAHGRMAREVLQRAKPESGMPRR
ncbi:MAG TPA: CoA ester lyase [Candidatus Dormibacteraeota bacterium]|nr:CoA ester lyase [Candidatus Dormibacteraeota bacterium]